jgi:hypothetical protein
MSLLNQRSFQAAVLGLGLLVSLGWCWSNCAAGNQRARSAQANAAECQRLARQIVGLRQRPSVAADRTLQQTELAQRIERAGRAAGIDPATSLIRIVPEDPRRLGDSAYLEVPTSVQWHDLSLQQCLTFLVELEQSDSALSCRDLRLTAPRQSAGPVAQALAPERWEVELTLVYRIYSPPSDAAAAVAVPIADGYGGI